MEQFLESRGLSKSARPQVREESKEHLKGRWTDSFAHLGMRVKLRRIVQSAESAKHQSPGRKPWEGHAYEPSPERAAQVFGRLCKSLCRPFRAEP